MFGKRLRMLREDAKLTQKELSKVLGITDRSVGYYETDERTPPPDILEKLADYFDTSVDYLLGRSDIKNIYKATSCNLSHKNLSKDNQLLNESFICYGKKTGIKQSLLNDIKNLSDDSKKALEEYVKLLKLKDKFDSNNF
ncbi:putative transcriptional regulator [Gottschalkia purinilytica]|uniref:Putative transcriptional regulator n=1 Tax=Gottschalkia purinilytica TaxID=1503 RepID=A0A0L0WCE5_GOTPU|nr:helix-turn-helix domain-containing protein [Gottschalkia purinilytica]KNF09138.1 putative transcriptional regulator [Gottschalkia purinilytica]